MLTRTRTATSRTFYPTSAPSRICPHRHTAPPWRRFTGLLPQNGVARRRYVAVCGVLGVLVGIRGVGLFAAVTQPAVSGSGERDLDIARQAPLNVRRLRRASEAKRFSLNRWYLVLTRPKREGSAERHYRTPIVGSDSATHHQERRRRSVASGEATTHPCWGHRFVVLPG